MQEKAKNKAMKKSECSIPPKVAHFRRSLRLYETELANLTDDDVPSKIDTDKYIKFVTLFTALLEVREKRASCFKQKLHLDLLTSKPRPQDRYQLYLAHSMAKKYRRDYELMEEVTLVPLKNTSTLFAGKAKADFEVTHHAYLSPNSTYTVKTDLLTEPAIDID